MKKILPFFWLLMLLNSIALGQNAQERAQIIAKTNVGPLQALSLEYKIKAQKEKENAIAIAKEKGWPITKKQSNGSFSELQKVDENGIPIYYITQSNLNAARTTRADQLWTGGSLGLALNGQDMIVGEWDGGAVRLTHREFGGRAVQKDNITFTTSNGNTAHATHVGGTLIASGVASSAKGMAHQGTLWANDWNDDEAEMAAQAAEGLIISNHSYGYDASFLPQWYFGFYDSEAANWDEIATNSPFYTIVKAAGNDRNDGYNPGGVFGQDAYNLVTGSATSKNVLVVAAVAAVTNYTGPSSVTMSAFSSWGPTDDGRIKPDISGCGVAVYSPVSSSNSAYSTVNGTSMASPNVAGSLLLVQQHYKNVNSGNFLRSATLRGLTIHTADEAGSDPGPDYAFGWGLMNAQKMVQTINNVGNTAILDERTLNSGASYTRQVVALGNEPLEVTICWNDPKGTPLSGGTLNSTSPRLVNDLDIRVTYNSTTTFPWRLDPANPSAAATKGDNFRDNVEKIIIENPVAGATYTITVTHKGTLRNFQPQNYSLIVTGANLNPVCAIPTGFQSQNITQTSANLSWSTATNASTYSLRYREQSTVSWTVSSLSVLNATITGLKAGTNYEWQVRSNCGFGSSAYSNSQFFTTNALICNPPTNLISQNITETTAELSWVENNNGTSWQIQYGPSGFAIGTGTTISATTLSTTITGLTPNTQYDYHIRTICGVSNISAWSINGSFQTSIIPRITILSQSHNNISKGANIRVKINIENFSINNLNPFLRFQFSDLNNNFSNATVAPWSNRGSADSSFYFIQTPKNLAEGTYLLRAYNSDSTIFSSPISIQLTTGIDSVISFVMPDTICNNENFYASFTIVGGFGGTVGFYITTSNDQGDFNPSGVFYLSGATTGFLEFYGDTFHMSATGIKLIDTSGTFPLTPTNNYAAKIAVFKDHDSFNNAIEYVSPILKSGITFRYCSEYFTEAPLSGALCNANNLIIGGVRGVNNQMRIDPPGFPNLVYYQVLDSLGNIELGRMTTKGINTRIQFSNYPSIFEAGKTYTIKAIFGPPTNNPPFYIATGCKITFAPSIFPINIPQTKIIDGACSSQNFAIDPNVTANGLGAMGINMFNAIIVRSATSYDFEVRDSNGNFLDIISSNHTGRIWIANHTSLFQYGQQYQIRTRANIGNVSGSWGPICTIGFINNPAVTTPSLTKLRDCNLLNDLTPNKILHRIQVSGATSYEFHFFTDSLATNTYTIVPILAGRQLIIGDITPGLLPNTTYFVGVKSIVGGIKSSLGDICSISTAAVFPKYANWAVSYNTSFSINAYPNPFSGSTTILIENDIENISNISLFDLFGRKLISKSVLTNQAFELGDNLAVGTYILEAQLKNGERKTFKILKIN